MSIATEIGQAETITEGSRAHELFVDRLELKRHFASYVNGDTPREKILFLHGDGGNGKSLLLRHLREHYCKRLRPDHWQALKAIPHLGTVARRFSRTTDAVPVPSVLLDFNTQPHGEDRPQEAFSALLALRRGLAEHRIRFPLFDFGCVWYLQKTQQLTPERLRDLFPAEEMDLIADIVHYLSERPLVLVANSALGALSKHLRQRFALVLQRRRLSKCQIDAIEAMDEGELLAHLPTLFAQDLNAAMRAKRDHQRLVLFFDTHEVLWGKERDFLDHLYFERDEWLRRLLTNLELTEGIVVVVAGRDRPRWAEAGRFQIPDHYVDLHHVGHLSVTEADRYLRLAGIDDCDLRKTLLTRAAVVPGQVHPLFLGLCVDAVIGERPQATNNADAQRDRIAARGREVMDRLLRYVGAEVGYAVAALSACPAFDRAVYFELGKQLGFQATEPAFVMLTKMSFVWPAKSHGPGWYRIHDLLHRLHHERGHDVTRRAAEVLKTLDLHREASAA